MRRPVLLYFVLVFAISWGGMLLVVGGGGNIPGTPERFHHLLPVAALTLTAGPVAAGLVLTGLFSGRSGFRELVSRLLRWRLKVRWYLVAILTTPVLLSVTLLVLSLRSSQYRPPVLTEHVGVAPVLVTIAAGLIGALCEELGWTGFAIPRLRQRHGVLATGLIVGTAWGAWHWLVNVWGSRGLAGELSLELFVPLYLVAGVVHLTAYRILMVWLYDRTGSLLVVVLMHASLIVSTVQTLLTPPTVGRAFLTWFIALTALLWMLVGGLAAAGRLRPLHSEPFAA